MAALNFPANPVNGQVYGAYTYDSSVAPGFWRSAAASNASTYVSLTAPSSTTSGDLWWKSDTGESFVNYWDGSSYQWVQTQSPVTGAGYVSPNYVINGAMDIWQRGTSFAAPTTEYKANTADRWNSFRSGFATGFTVSRQSAGLIGFQYCVRIQRDSGNTSTASITFNQTFESVSSTPLAGKPVTLSFYARAGANFSASGNVYNFGVSSGTGTDQNVQSGFTGGVSIAQVNAVLTTSWQRFTVTGTVPSTSTQLGIAGGFVPVGTAGANDYVEITGVQLEEGSAATTFRRNGASIQGELAACQRYYATSYPPGVTAGTANTWSGTVNGDGAYEIKTTSYLITKENLPVAMRVTPSITIYSPNSGATGTVIRDRIAIASTDSSAINVNDATNKSFQVYSSSGIDACRIVFHYTANAEL